MQLLKATQMRAIEIAAMNAGVVTWLELMEHAGRGVERRCMNGAPNLRHRPATLSFCAVREIMTAMAL